MTFSPVEPRLDLPALETEILAQWRDRDVFAESLRRRESSPEWVFYEGPPTANGRPGIHHVWARLFKDIYPRFHTMRGKHVPRKAGWDCHGLPVEVEVEKELGFSGKPEIEDFGIEEFNRRCRASVQRYVEDWSSLTSRIGMWLDMSDAYWTMSNEFIESVWWIFHEMWDQGLIYEGSKVVPYCGRCGTALSSHELGQPDAYRDLTEDSVYVRLPVRDRDFDLLVWTTTPWTLVSNVGAAVSRDIDYVRVRSPQGGRDLVMARARVEPVLGEGARIVETVDPGDLVGLHYERPFDWLPVDAERGNRVVAADFVTVDDGTGIVHLAPAFGEIDREVGEAESLPMLNPINAQARFDDTAPDVAGLFAKDADPKLIELLRASGALHHVESYTHSYPHCWRCGRPLIYWAKPTWFAATSSRKDDLIRENETIGWHPEHIKHGRFGDWLANNVDWALSRDRFWGTPIPVWRCGTCGHDTCVGSVDELAKLASRSLADLDLHRPYVDDIVVDCPECESGRAIRIEPVLDAWFDSGSMPSAQWHYPFEHADTFEARFPADFICEAIDQTRGWFYSLLAVNTLVFGRTPYKNVVCLALVLDPELQKMSKSRGNVLDPWTILAERGADALRWNFVSGGSPWMPKRVSVESIDETTSSFLIRLWNIYAFFTTYANIDGWEPPLTVGFAAQRDTRLAAAHPTHVLDRWILSRLHSTTREVTEALESFDALRAAHGLDRLVDDLSNWYVRRSRPRFWKASDPTAHAVLHECLTTIAQLLAPLCPFVADAVYQNLARTEDSVHLSDWPVADTSAIDSALEAEMERAREVASLGHSARKGSELKTRQPLPRALVLLPGGEPLSPEIADEVADELNVKRLEPVSSLEGLLDYSVVPNFATLGPKVGKLVPRIKAALGESDGAAVRAALDETGVYRLDVDGTTVELGAEDVEVRAASHEEFALAQGGGVAVAIDTTIDEDLRLEGYARELVRALNDLRKSTGLAIADRVRVKIATSDPLEAAVRAHRDWIAGEVLATELSSDSEPDAGRAHTLTIEGTRLDVELTKV
ncbi:MAG TPA: isoleucine--tRNA ligase [Acidimicrobiia bacterium]